MADKLIAPVYSDAGAKTGEVALDPTVFGLEPNVPVMHQVVTAQLAGARAGTAKTKTRSEVRGGGRKPWRQKGLGRARHGSIRSPQWVGGGVVHGPIPRSYAQRTPKKMKRLALRSALSARAADARVKVVEPVTWSAPKTKQFVDLLEAMELSGKVLLVTSSINGVAARSARNLQQVVIAEPGQVTTYDVLWADDILFTDNTVGLVGGSAGYGPSDDDFVREDAEGGTE
ncbi:MAG TPA: 50S ribosomal protein L4 [Acidimicrobiia bacterium]|nr:50S ribosomal protein L4 [Acidimicrobiia bacterium]